MAIRKGPDGGPVRDASPPHPVQRAVVALLLGALLGAVAALLQPRRPLDTNDGPRT